MFKASRDFVILSLDGSRLVEQNLREGQPATIPSILDYYLARPSTPLFNNITLLNFAKGYCMPKEPSTEPNHRRKEVILVVRPYYPPDHNGPNYENYCHQKLMIYMSFRHVSDILGEHDTFAEAYANFLLSSNAPSLQDDIHLLEQQPVSDSNSEDSEVTLHDFHLINVF